MYVQCPDSGVGMSSVGLLTLSPASFMELSHFVFLELQDSGVPGTPENWRSRNVAAVCADSGSLLHRPARLLQREGRMISFVPFQPVLLSPTFSVLF